MPWTAAPVWATVDRDDIVSIYRLMYAKVGNRPDAEDLTSQVFLAALPQLRRDADGGEVRGHLVAMARSVLAGYWCRRLGVPLTSIDEAVSRGDEIGAEQARARRHSRRLQQVLAALPADDRSILELRFLEGCSIRDAALRMGISAGRARQAQYHALRRVAELGAERGGPPAQA
jgi:RNA polymerase sigma-70 factor, ECF subfamily